MLADLFPYTVDVWGALGYVAGAYLAYRWGLLKGFNEGVVHGRASQGAVNELADRLNYEVVEPGHIEFDADDLEAAYATDQILEEDNAQE